MKGFLVLFAIAAVAAANQCPSEQVDDPTIEKLLPHADCTKFYKCAYGQPAEQLCPSGLYYHIENEQCDYRENVDCGARTDPNVEAVVPEVPAESQEETNNVSQENSNENQETDPASQENNSAGEEDNANQENNNVVSSEEVDGGLLPNGCPVNGETNLLLPHKFKKNWFYQCVWGKRVPFKCPAGLIFNAEIQVCDNEPENKENVDSVRFVN